MLECRLKEQEAVLKEEPEIESAASDVMRNYKFYKIRKSKEQKKGKFLTINLKSIFTILLLAGHLAHASSTYYMGEAFYKHYNDIMLAYRACKSSNYRRTHIAPASESSTLISVISYYITYFLMFLVTTIYFYYLLYSISNISGFNDSGFLEKIFPL